MNLYTSFFASMLFFFMATDGSAQQPSLSLNCQGALVQAGDNSPNNPQLWNADYFWDNVLSSHDLCEGPLSLSVSTADTCVGGSLSFRYQLFLDLDGDGQMETLVDSQQLPPADTIYVGNNDGDADLTDGVARRFDFRPVPANQKWRFGLQTTLNPATGLRTATFAWNNSLNPNVFVVPELPHGYHKIKWFVSDGCGNEQICSSNVLVSDKRNPEIVCIPGLSVNIMPTGMIQLWANDFLQYTLDNCTPEGLIKLGIRRSGTGTGFPVDGNGNPITSVTFTCPEVGTQSIELWAIDAAGNADYCETYVLVQDNVGNCNGGDPGQLCGQITTANGDGMEQVSIEIIGTNPNLPPFSIWFNNVETNGDGNYCLPQFAPLSNTMTLRPLLDINPLNGVSTYDLVLISKHILGVEALNSPYKIIAADANRSGSVTTFDIVELRKLILGIYNKLPNNTSWRFINQSFTFPNAINPFASAFPEYADIIGLFAGDFIGVKIGDVNNSALPNLLSEADDRTPLPLHCENKYLKAGESVEIPFSSTENILGAQFTLEFAGLSLEAVLPGKNLNEDNFALFGDLLTFSNEKPGAFDFVLRFKAEADGYVSEKLRLSSKKTANEAYLGQGGERHKMSFAFTGGPEFSLFQNQPNPFSAETSISFNLPEDMEISLSVSDQNGKKLWEKTAAYSKGLNTETIQATQLPGQGLYTCSMRSAKGNFVRKMVKMK